MHTLNDFQKLLGDINWIRPYCNFPNAELCPLFDILKRRFRFTISSPINTLSQSLAHMSGICVTSVQYQNFSRAANLSCAIGVMMLGN